MALTQKDVAALASYARIALEGDELEEMTAYLNDAVAMLEKIRNEYGQVEPTFHPIGELSNVMREDAPRAGLPRAEALENAGSVEDVYFRVPRILGEEASE
jgi:aspartyl-tRNA(Asn)/glutamyl-tRNA(Gln) amidotransferase subunit C